MIVLFLLASIFQLIQGQDTIWMNDLQLGKENLAFHIPGIDKPFSGYAYEITKDDAKTISRFYLVKGEVRFVTNYYSSGEKKSNMKYGIQGPIGNIYVEYHPNGKKKIESKYYFSKKLKIWKYWNSNGKICKIEKYAGNGLLIETKKYKEDCEN